MIDFVCLVGKEKKEGSSRQNKRQSRCAGGYDLAVDLGLLLILDPHVASESKYVPFGGHPHLGICYGLNWRTGRRVQVGGGCKYNMSHARRSCGRPRIHAADAELAVAMIAAGLPDRIH